MTVHVSKSVTVHEVSNKFNHLTICPQIPFSERIHNNTMNDKNTYSVDKYLEIIAEKEGITKEEVHIPQKQSTRSA